MLKNKLTSFTSYELLIKPLLYAQAFVFKTFHIFSGVSTSLSPHTTTRMWPFDKIIWSSFFHLFFLCARPFKQKLGSSLIYFFYLYTTIRPKLGVTLTLKFILFLIVPIFCLQYCLYISSAITIPLYFVHYIHRSATPIFRTLYPWLYYVYAEITIETPLTSKKCRLAKFCKVDA